MLALQEFVLSGTHLRTCIPQPLPEFSCLGYFNKNEGEIQIVIRHNGIPYPNCLWLLGK